MKPSAILLLRLSGLLLLLLVARFAARAQTGVTIGASTAPDVSAALDIISTSKGVLLPRVALATAIATPATGLLVFQTTAPAGYYYNAGTPASPSWQALGGAGGGATVTADNGLTKTGTNIALGGTLTAPTTLSTTAANPLTLTGAGALNLGTGAADGPLALGRTGGTVAVGPLAGTGTRFVTADASGNLGSSTGATSFIQNQTSPVQTGGFNLSGAGTIGGLLKANAVQVDVANTNNGGLSDNALRFGSLGDHGIACKQTSGGIQSGLDFYTNGSPKLSLTNGGRVGIGVTTPLQRLEVQTGGIRVGGSGSFTAVAATNQGTHLQWNRSGTDGETWLINHLGGTGAANAGIRFAGITTATGTAPTEWARFLNNGNFGIGTPSPNSPLQVNGAVSVAYTTASADLTLTSAHYTVRRVGGCNILTLPHPNTCLGRLYVLINSNGTGSNVTLTVPAGVVIYDDVTNITFTVLVPSTRIVVQSDGTNWIVVGR